MSEDKRIFFIDAYSLIFRSYYAFIRNPRINSKGLNTSAIFGFVNSLLDIINNEKPTHLAVAFDYPAKTFRKDIYPAYKANREATPEDIREAVPIIKDILAAFHIPVLEKEGYEADDIIGTLAKASQDAGYKVYMMTTDKDYIQLIDENIWMYKPGKAGKEKEILGIPEVKEKYEIDSPLQFIDILTLMGDTADNIPGAPGVGEKTALKLIQQFKSVENLLENTSELKGKQKEKIEENKDLINLSKELVTINLAVPVEYDLEQMKCQEPDEEKLKNLLAELEFNTILKRIFNVEAKPAGEPVQGSLFGSMPEVSSARQLKTIEDTDHEYHLVNPGKELDHFIKKALNNKEICFDTETTDLNTREASLVGISFSFKAHEGYYVPVPEDVDQANKILEKVKPLFENQDMLKIGQNLKYDLLMLKNYGIEVKGPIFDTMIAHYLIQPELKHNLDYLAEVYLDYAPVSIESLIGKKGKNQQSMRNIEVEKVKEYACEDADITYQLYLILKDEIDKNGLAKLFYEMEIPLVNVLTGMEYHGVKINKQALHDYSKVLREECQEVESEIFELAGTDFNVSSPKQLGEVLFDKLKIDPNARKTKTKQYSTSEEVLQKLVDKHPIIDKILTYRSLTKLISTYVDALPKLVNQHTGKLHTSYNQTITATGRLSSNNPNLQNIPIREERGREIRKAFIATDDEHVLLSADYSQIELRLMAHMSQDPRMLEAFKNNEDIHAATAAKVFKVDDNEVSKEMRSKAKTANFGIIYGISAFGLSQRLNIPRTEAKDLIDGYFESFPDVKAYMDQAIAKARKDGYVETLLGRKRYLPDINSRNATVRGFAERNAINAPIQGTAADIIKMAMINIYQRMQDGFKTKMILQVHDELIFDVAKDELDAVSKLVVEEMQNAYKLDVPLLVEHGSGTNWLEAH